MEYVIFNFFPSVNLLKKGKQTLLTFRVPAFYYGDGFGVVCSGYITTTRTLGLRHVLPQGGSVVNRKSCCIQTKSIWKSRVSRQRVPKSVLKSTLCYSELNRLINDIPHSVWAKR